MTNSLQRQKDQKFNQAGLSNYKLMGLVYSSGIGERLSLSKPAIIVLNALCYHWNTIRKDMFPTQQFISSKTGLSESSIKRAIQELLSKGLIIKTKKNHSSTNLYKFTNNFFEQLNLTSNRVQLEPTHEVNLNPPCIEHKKENMRKEHTSLKTNVVDKQEKKNDDVFTKNPNLTEYKAALDKLESWNVLDAKILIKQYGLEKIKNCIEVTENNKTVKSSGAYFRKLLNVPGMITSKSSSVPLEAKEELLIDQMVKFTWWRHKPTKRLFNAVPDTGTHINFKYYKTQNLVQFHFDDHFCDILENFEVIVESKKIR